MRTGKVVVNGIAFVVAALFALAPQRDAWGRSTPPRAAVEAAENERCRVVIAEPAESASALYRQGLCARRIGDWATAANAFTRWLELEGNPAARTKEVRERLLPPLIVATARLVVDPPVPRVKIDGKETSTTRGVVYARPGLRVVGASDVKGSIVELRVVAGETKHVVLAQRPKADVIALGGAAVEEPVVWPEAATPPAHAILAAAVPGALHEVETGSVGLRRVALGLAASAVLAAGAGVAFTLSSHADAVAVARGRRAAHLNGQTCYGRNNDACKEIDDVSTSASLKQTVAIGCFAGAGALAVGTLLTYLAWPGAETVRVGASATPGGAYASGSVRF